MTESSLTQNVYRLAQKEFAAIPGNPWVYWVSDSIRNLFKIFPKLDKLAEPKQGLATADNTRFLRYWWEIGIFRTGIGCQSRDEARQTRKIWFPCMKGGLNRKWFGNQDFVINWHNDGRELREFKFAFIRNQDSYFHEGLTFTDLSSTHLAIRWMPNGFVYDHAGNALFQLHGNVWCWLSLLNSQCFSHLIQINPTIHFYIGDFKKMPIPANALTSHDLCSRAQEATRIQIQESTQTETTFDFITPFHWFNGLQHISVAKSRLATLEGQIDDEVYRLYGILDEDRSVIKAESSGDLLSDEDKIDLTTGEEAETDQAFSTITLQELAVRWISYAAGVILGRFQPGVAGALGSAIYHRSDFAIGSLPAPDEAEFDELVGAPERFACVDPQGGRHVFPAQVEQALRTLAISDGIAVLDEGHPRDLARLVEQALVWMLGEQGAEEVIQTIDQGRKTNDARPSSTVGRPSSLVLRQFLEKDFFTAWHFKWYRKRPVYWPIQSSKRAYGFVIFHEKITRETLYTIQREPYLDTKRNAVALKIADVQQALGHATGVQRKKLEKQLDELQKLADELAAFAKDLEAITLGGYEPEENWIDDGVILRMAPLWKVIPIWKSEPKKYWERLENGDFDWSHIAMKYWPDRVKEKCKTNKSYAIAHGVEG